MTTDTATIPTRAQRDLNAAFDRVDEFARQYPDSDDVPAERREANRKLRKAYGSLCHSFPVVVLRDGLCQALAFYEAKAKNGNNYQTVLDHVRQIVGNPADPSLAKWSAGLPLDAYMRHSSRLLDAWVFHKRFAESILDVKSAADAEDEQ